jgi:ABC-type transporter Mla subunit MlaD
MPLQDLTPELRTRLSRVERAVGWFVAIATILLLVGFAYYLYATAQKRGWFVTKINFATSLNDATGFKPGNAVKLMGLDVGEVTRLVPNDPKMTRGLTIYFNVREPYYGYVWYDSHVRVVSDFLGNRYLEIEKGVYGQPTVTTNHAGEMIAMNRYTTYTNYMTLTNELTKAAGTNKTTYAILVEATNKLMEMIKADPERFYTNAERAGYTRPVDLTRPIASRNYYWIPSLDTPALGDRLNAVADELEAALPNILMLTNQLSAVLSNANNAVAHLDTAVKSTDPILTNLAAVTGNLRNPNGSLGDWLLPTNLSAQLHATLASAKETLDSAHTALDHTDTNVTLLATDLDKTLLHLSDLTSNLAWQVQVNTNMLTDISTTIVHADDLIQGLKREWFLRSAFKKKPAKQEKAKESSPAPASTIRP